MHDDSLSSFFPALRTGAPEAANKVWSHFHARLVMLANSRLEKRVRRIVDGEDIAQAVFNSCFRAVSEGRVPDLYDRDNLWAFLVEITARKTLNANRDERAQKRGGGRVLGESAFLNRSDSFSTGLNDVAGDEPSPELVTEVVDSTEWLLNSVDSDARAVVMMKLEGHWNREIAARLGFSLAKVERKLAIARERCTEQFLEASPTKKEIS
jgi:DNA-directed RNA polymerase specialized sigma24 family protein